MRMIRAFTLSVTTLALAVLPATATAAQEVGAAADEGGASVAAYEVDRAVKGTPPADVSCIEVTGAIACFQQYGDKWWVKDTAADGASAVAVWNNYRNGSLYRQGQCENRLGAGTWGVCNKNYYEDSVVEWAACVVDFSENRRIRCS